VGASHRNGVGYRRPEQSSLRDCDRSVRPSCAAASGSSSAQSHIRNVIEVLKGDHWVLAHGPAIPTDLQSVAAVSCGTHWGCLVVGGADEDATAGTPEMLRHGHATAALEAGVPMKVVSERLGHSGIAITSDVYSHVTAATDLAAAALVAAVIDGP
jgi:integrase